MVQHSICLMLCEAAKEEKESMIKADSLMLSEAAEKESVYERSNPPYRGFPRIGCTCRFTRNFIQDFHVIKPPF